MFGQLAAGRTAAPEPFDATDEAVSAAMMRAWVAFARDGDPDTEGSAHWPAFEAGDELHLEFGDTVRTGTDDRRAQLDFLERYYSSH